MDVSGLSGAFVTLVRQRLLWVFAAIAVTGWLVLFAPFPESDALSQLRSEHGGYILAAAVLSSALFVFGGIDALIHWVSRRPGPPLKVVPMDQKSWWHRSTQSDGRKTTQIVAEMSVYNESEKPIRLAKAELTSPRANSKSINASFTLPRPDGAIHGDYSITPGHKVEGMVQFLVDKELGVPPRPMKVRFVITDQHGNRYGLKVMALNR